MPSHDSTLFVLDGDASACDFLQRVRQRMSTLTPRENDVFRQLCMGKTGKEIGAGLGISYKTVEKFRAQVLRKLGAENLVELLTIAVGLGLFSEKSDAAGPQILS